MERSKCIFLILVCMMFTSMNGQNKLIYEAYISGDMRAWEGEMTTLKPTTDEEMLELVNYQYGYIGWCIDQKKNNEANKYLKKAEKMVDILEDKDYQESTLLAYKAAFIGFEIGMNPVKAPFIGMRSLSYAEESEKLDAENYFTYLQLGNIDFYMPKVFGGSKTEAIAHYLTSLELIEKDKQKLVYNWNYLSILAIIIEAYYQIGEYDKAEEYCKKTLSIEPDFLWVKNTLYPKIRASLNLEE